MTKRVTLNAETKATSSEVAQRIFYVEQMLLDGKRRMHILEHCMAKWNLSDTQIDRYMQEARKHLKSELSLAKQEYRNKAIRHYWNLYDKAIIAGDLKVAHDVLDKMSKLNFLYDKEESAPNQITITYKKHETE